MNETHPRLRMGKLRADELEWSRARELFSYDPEGGDFTWMISRGSAKAGDVAGGITGAGYIRLRADGINYFAHRLAWLIVFGEWPIGEIDHRDGNKANNRLGNLRDVSRTINAQNQRVAQANNTSGFLGVSWNKQRGKWSAWITRSGKHRHVGGFATPEAAYAAYLESKRRLHEGCTI